MSPRSHKHPNSRTQSSTSVALTQADNIALPDGAISEQAVELLNDFVRGQHNHTHRPDSSADSLQVARDDLKKLPWWRRPSPWWLLGSMPLIATVMGSTIAPRIEIYTVLACRVLKPEYTATGALARLGTPFTIVRSLSTAPSFPKCAGDPEIQAAVAKLSAVMATSSGVLTCLTTAWWGSFSDRHGRTSVLGISVLGLLITDFNFIFVATFTDLVPFGYWFLLAGPLIEGAMGGLSAAIAASHAYIADTTEPSERSRLFSISLGLMFSGIALGPTLGGLLIRLTGSVLSVFYISTAVHLLYAVLVWFALPESLTVEDRKRSTEIRAQEISDHHASVIGGRLRRFGKAAIGFLTPLGIFLPKSHDHGNPLKAPAKDWNLTLLAASYASMICLIGGQSYKYQFASYKFHWDSAKIGYWLSLIGGARAIFLTILLPATIKLFQVARNRKHSASRQPQSSETDTLLPESDDTASSHKQRGLFFDLVIARVSLFVDTIAYVLISAYPSPVVFVIYGCMSAFGSGFTPALQSVALELYTRGGGIESGKLFGALGVLQALCSLVIGPSLFGFTFIRTVSVFPQAIFFLSAALAATSLLFLLFVRIRPKSNQLWSEEGDVADEGDEMGSHGSEAILAG